MNTEIVVTSPSASDTPAPSECCETEGLVVRCEDGVDTIQCWVCGSTWTEACA